MTRVAATSGALAILLCGIGTDNAFAQPGRFEIGGSGLWVGGYPLGTRDALETRSSIGGDPFVLFKTETDAEATPGGEIRGGVRITRALWVEVAAAFSKPVVSTQISADAENAPALTVTEDVTQYLIDASIVYHLLPIAFSGRRGLPFIMGGVGYLRQLHEGNALVETGRAYHAGGGVELWLMSRTTLPSRTRQRQRHGLKGIALRGDVRLYVREEGIEFDEGTRRSFFVAGAGVTFAF